MMIRRFFDSLFQIISHLELAEATAQILANDGKEETVLFLNTEEKTSGKKFIELLATGTQDADRPLSGGYILTLWHFHHPWSHRGYLVSRSSADEIAAIFARATALWQEEKKGEAVYQLGRALHLLQDIFIPQHSGITGTKGHGDLEKWLTENWGSYQVTSGGYYQWEEDFYDQDYNCHHVSSTKPYDWIDHGSHLSIEWYEKYFAAAKYDENTFRTVAPFIVQNSLRFSAGFIHLFFSKVHS